MHQIKIAILDMYKGEPNQGMRNIHEILDSYAANKKLMCITKYLMCVANTKYLIYPTMLI
nr:hypothetical protein [Bacteroidota bacterium]